jgi:hypothetical protein
MDVWLVVLLVIYCSLVHAPIASWLAAIFPFSIEHAPRGH